ncbi:unnamed protein product [Caenorhabditis angaria]|uniref:Uncharacterized protein n=1 Tax=Caenorhabditis angaria TaxID=860376 RepID=A0A9P1J1D9_9PELO|nr:unnamed protein product [Caenorhabditis angaria]
MELRSRSRALKVTLSKNPTIDGDDTQPVDESLDDLEQPKPYAKLVGVRNGISNIELYDENFVCGRGGPDSPVNYSFSALVKDRGLYNYISKIQFSLTRDFNENVTRITDLSRNGTLINHEELEKNVPRELHNGDLISIGIPRLIVFVYEDMTDCELPEELTRKYNVTSHALGKGGYGKVLLGYRKRDKMNVAVKLVNTQFSIRCSRAVAKSRDIKNEVDVMKKLNHPNVVKIYDWITIRKCSYMVIEYVGGGEFFSKVVDPRYNRLGVGEVLGKYYAFQLIDAITYLHSLGVCHRDIKPENILCTSKQERCLLKLTDFGMAKNNTSRMKTKCGTPSYNAPEIVENEGNEYTPKVDVWSLGCVLFITFSGYPPFSEEYDDMSMNDQVLKGRLIFHSQWRRITVETQDIIKRMLTVDPHKRPTAQQLLDDKWMQCAESRRARHDVLVVTENERNNNGGSNRTMKVRENEEIAVKRRRIK